MPDPNIRSYYEGNTSRTDVDSKFPVFKPATVKTQAEQILRRPAAPPPPVFRAPSPAGPDPSTYYPPERLAADALRDPLALMKQMDQYEGQKRSAAMRPVGLGPGMIPGMGIDPRLLPQRMQASNSTFQNIAGPSDAGLGPSAPQQSLPSSNAGFDYLPASEQARWLAAYARGR